MGNAAAPDAEVAAGLGAGGYFQRHLIAFQRWHRFDGAQGGLGHIKRHTADQVEFIPHKQGVFPDAHLHIKVAGGAAVAAGVALAGDANLHSIVDAGGDGDGAVAPPPLVAPRAAVATGGFNGAAGAVAGGAGGGDGKLPEHAALGAPHLPAAATGGAGGNTSAGFVAGAGAVVAGFHPLEVNIPLAAEHRILKGNGDALADVLAGAGPLGGLPAAAAAEKGVKDVAEAAEGVEAVKGAVAAGAAGAVDAGVAEAVVARPLLLVAEDLVGFVNFLELVLGARRAVAVGMELHSLPAKGAADFLIVGAPGHTEGFVVVNWHRTWRIAGRMGSGLG